MDVLLASGNRHKHAEYERLFAGSDLQVMTPAQAGVQQLDVREDGTSFQENAIKKATAYLEAYGRPCLADDSGICVDALAGAPGVRSARFGGPSLYDAGRLQYLVTCLATVPPGWRGAHYVCALALAVPRVPLLLTSGMLYGEIALTPGTGSTGFGYDPIFLVPAYGCTVADLLPEQKDTISHRGLAVRRVLALWHRSRPQAGTL